MSEVLNEEVTSSEEGGFSRRRVAKGVAWSVPVIVTAIAAPAAAASPSPAPTATVTAEWVYGAPPTFVSSGGTGAGTNRTGTGPAAFRILSTGGATSGSISGTIDITPVGTVDAGVGVQSIALVPPTQPSYSTAHAYQGTFSSTVSLASGQSADFALAFQYETVKSTPKKGTTYSFTMVITLRLPDNTSRTLTDTTLSITY